MNLVKYIFIYLWDVLHHFICQQTLVKSLTSFYICSNCYSSHPLYIVNSAFESNSTWYNKLCQIYFYIFVGCFTSLHMSSDLSEVCNLFLHLFWMLLLSPHYIFKILELEYISTWFNKFCQINISLFVGCFKSLHMSTDLSHKCNKFLHLF